MYYIRKMTKPFNFNKIQDIESVEDIDSDIVRQELSTKENTLSFWKCESLDRITDTIKAIILSTSEITKGKFVIIDSTVVEDYGLEVDESNPGNTGYRGFENHHVDICNLTYKKLGLLLGMYKDIFKNDCSTCNYDKEDVKNLIVEVIRDDLLDKDALNESLKKDVEKLAKKNNITI